MPKGAQLRVALLGPPLIEVDGRPLDVDTRKATALFAYLAFTALLAAGLDGIERQMDPGEPIRENLFDKSDEEINALGVTRFPGTLLDAVRELPDDDVLRSALGKVRDGDYIDYFAQVKEAEFREYHADVSAWEINRYLTLF